jgi:hypothetical protein
MSSDLLWEVPNVPHKGWDLIGVDDLEEPIGRCQFCGKDDIRYLHSIEHREWLDPRYAIDIDRAHCKRA